ncbi:MAG: cysteine hydrolase [Opitutales bacterium]|nr:cysteine hydrolase [Opitutales bacterium]
MNTVLLLIDLQYDYFLGGANPLSGADEAVNAAAYVLNLFRNKGLPVIHVRHLSTRGDSTFFIPGTKGAEIHEAVFPLDDEVVVEKHFPNSFFQTGLLETLRVIGADRIVVCGMMTHMCVDATVRAAKDHGFSVTLIADACATKDLFFAGQAASAVQVQTSFLAALNYFYADVVASSSLLA